MKYDKLCKIHTLIHDYKYDCFNFFSSVTKLVYGHYCSSENVKELLDMDSLIFMNAVVICKYTNGGRPGKCETWLFRYQNDIW